MSSIKKQKFKIDGMHCSSCAMNIDFDLEDLEGIKSAKTSYAKQESTVEYDEKVITEDGIVSQIVKTGYKASVKD